MRTDHDRIATVPELGDRSRRIDHRQRLAARRIDATRITLLSSLLLRPRNVAPYVVTCHRVPRFRHRIQLPDALESARRQHPGPDPRIRPEPNRSEAAPRGWRFRPGDAQQSRLVDAADGGRRGAVRMLAVVRRSSSGMGGASRGIRMIHGGGEGGRVYRVRFSIGKAQRGGG